MKGYIPYFTTAQPRTYTGCEIDDDSSFSLVATSLTLFAKVQMTIQKSEPNLYNTGRLAFSVQRNLGL
jgi:hypothetical protein